MKPSLAPWLVPLALSVLALPGIALAQGEATPPNEAELCAQAMRSRHATAEERAAADANWDRGTAVQALDSIPEDSRPPAYLKQNRYLIGGQILEWNGPMEEIASPVRVRLADGTEKAYPLGQTPLMDHATGLKAYHAAREAWNGGEGAWPSMSLDERVERMRVFLGKMRERREDLIRWVMWEIGKTRPLAVAEVDRTIKYAEDTIAEALKLRDERRELKRQGKEIFKIEREPLGVVPIFAPYNYPLNETFTTLIPALLMGNTVVVKPAKWGVLLMEPLLEAFRDSFPAGAVNFVNGDGREVFQEILDEGGFEGLGFIGGERAAAAIMRANANPQRTRAILGLGAKNASIVLNDADLKSAIEENLEGCLSYNGQRCTAHKILFVQRGIAARFLPAFAAAVDALRIGQPYEEGTQITASPDTGWAARMDDFVKDATAKGAWVANLLGGRSANGFYAPTVLAGVTRDMKIYYTEQFGTVVPVVIFDELEEVVQYHRESRYGQQAAVFSNDPAAVAFLQQKLRRKVARLNLRQYCRRSPDWVPFGARGDSGLGTLSLRDALLSFSSDFVLCEKVPDGQASLIEQVDP